jgi:hypothetical protein
MLPGGGLNSLSRFCKKILKLQDHLQYKVLPVNVIQNAFVSYISLKISMEN